MWLVSFRFKECPLREDEQVMPCKKKQKEKCCPDGYWGLMAVTRQLW